MKTDHTPDLDALEARLLDAERADLLVEYGVRFTDIKWLIAAARELHEWEKHHCEKRITTRCPACGHQTLFIAVGGHLTCSWLKCPEPSPERAWKDTDLELEHVRGRAVTAEMRAEQAEAERDALRAALGEVRAVVAELVAVDRRRLSRVVADIDAALAPEQSVEVRCPCCNDTGRCTYADGSSHACPTCAPEQWRAALHDDEPDDGPVRHLYAGRGIEDVVCGQEGGSMVTDRSRVTCVACLAALAEDDK